MIQKILKDEKYYKLVWELITTIEEIRQFENAK